MILPRLGFYAEAKRGSFAMFGIGYTELIIVGVIMLLLFGNRLPSVMRSMGRGIVEFKKGVQGIEDEVDSVVKETKKPGPQEPRQE